MKNSGKQILLTVFLGFVLPSLIFSIYMRLKTDDTKLEKVPETTASAQTTHIATEVSSQETKKEYTLPVLFGDGTI